VEIPYKDLGWVVFDPSPAATNSDQSPALAGDGNDPKSTNDRASAVSLEGNPALRMLSKPFSYPLLWISILLLMILPLAFGGRKPGERKQTKPPRTIRPCRDLLSKMLATLAKLGHRRRHGQALEHYLRDLQLVDALPIAVIQEAIHAYQEVRFGGKEFTAQRRSLMTEAATTLRLQLTAKEPSEFARHQRSSGSA
jgi:hypothetical protein